MDDSAEVDEHEETPTEWLERSFEARRADERYGRTTISVSVPERHRPVGRIVAAGFRGGNRP